MKRENTIVRMLVMTAVFGILLFTVKMYSAEAAVSPRAWKRINGVCYNGSGVAIQGAITRGIDVSEWNEQIDWMKVKQSDVDFAFVRVAYGSSRMDKYYDYNMKQANAAGLPVGVYVYSIATTEKQAIAEAQLAIRKMNGYKVSYPVVYDLEDSRIQALSGNMIVKLAKAFCEEVKRAGYYPMIYCNTNWYDNYVDWSQLSGYDVWLARYSDTSLEPSRSRYRYTIWQSTCGDVGTTLNTTRGLVDGIPKDINVDMNFGFVDYTKKIAPRTYTAATYVPTSLAANGWYKINGKLYYYVDGKKATGLRKVAGKYYYLDPATGELYVNRMFKPKGKNFWYYAGAHGVIAQNQWVKYGSRTYYMKGNGKPAQGLCKIDKKYYYFDPTRFYMYKDQKVLRKSGDILYFGSDGACIRNRFQQITENGRTYIYCFGANYRAYKGWKKINGKYYYFSQGNTSAAGRMFRNMTVQKADGTKFVFDASGVLIRIIRP